MTFLHESRLLLLLLIPLMLAFLVWRGMMRRAALERIGDPALIKMLVQQISYERRRWKAALWLLALAALIIAIAQPTWGIEAERAQTQGVQVVIALDVSRSMDAEDMTPNRLQRAKFDIEEIFTALEGNDFALVLFAGDAVNYMPLTYDSHAANVFLEGVSTRAIGNQGTAIARAIDRSLQAFDTRTNAQQIIILMSDGEDHEGDVTRMAQRAADLSITIHAVGYGTRSGSIIPIYDEDGRLMAYHQRGQELVETRLQEASLRQVADITGGRYIAAIDDASGLQTIIDDIANAQAGDLGTQIITRPVNRFGVFVLLAILALSLEILLPEAKRV